MGEASPDLPPAETAARVCPPHRSGGSGLFRLAAGGGAALAIAAAMVLLPGRGGRETSTAAQDPLDARVPVPNQPAPSFALPDLDGQIVRLSELRGQVALVNFRATWCGPCRAELPDIDQVYRAQRHRELCGADRPDAAGSPR